MSQSHRIKGGTTGEAFQEQCFLWERGAPVGRGSFTCARKCKTLKESGTIKTT